MAGVHDRAVDLAWRPVAALLAVPLFALYFGGVVAGSVVQGMVWPGAHMGWLQQVGGIVAVVVGIALLRDRRTLLALVVPTRAWVVRAVLTGLSIAAAAALASAVIGDPPERHGLEYFAYQATMPGLSEELGFRGLVLGILLAALARPATTARIAVILVVAALPFAALHVLDQSGLSLVVLFAFTLYAGIVLGWLRLTTGSLVATIVAHNVANVAAGALDLVLLAVR